VEYLPQLTACVAAQTVPYAEAICYDDGSTDATAQVAEALGFRVLRGGKQSGPAAAREALLRSSRTEYVHFHDADDVMDPRFVELMGQSVGPNTAAVCILREIPVNGKEVLHTFVENDFSDPPLLLTRRFIHYNQTVFPARIARQSMKFAHELQLYEDMLAFFSISCAGLRFAYVDKPLTTWIRRSNSLMHRQSWSDGTKALFGYARYALPMASAEVKPHFVQYIVRKAFMNYAEDASTFPDVKHILNWLRECGYCGVEGMGTKERIVNSVVGPGAAFWVRRRWAVFRGVIRSSSGAG